MKKVKTVKTQIEQAKLESGIQVDKLAEWSAGVEVKQAEADKEITDLSKTLVQINYKTSPEAKKNAKRSWPREIKTNNCSLNVHN